MKKAMGFMAGVGSVALAGFGMYLMSSRNTKKQLSKSVNSALNDADKMINKKMNSMK